MSLPQPFRHWKIILLMVAIFVAGAICGTVFAGGSVWRGLMRVVNFDGWTDRTVHQYQKDLKLTPDQIEKIRPVVESRRPEMLRIRNEAIGKIGHTLGQMNAEIRPLLTPEQATKFDEINKARGERLRKGLKLDQPPK